MSPLSRPRQATVSKIARTGLLLAALVALAVWWLRPDPVRDAHPADRARRLARDEAGGSAGTQPLDRGWLVVYAAARRPGGGAGPLRIVADLPSAEPGRISRSEHIAFGVRDLRAPAYVTIFGVQDDGTVHLYLPRPAGEPIYAQAGVEPMVFRPSISLAASHRLGRLVVHALFTAAPLDPEATRRALASGDTLESTLAAADPSSFRVNGVLTVEP
jgi:hypothetical protein